MPEVASANIYTGASEGSGRVSIITEPPLPATCVICVRSADGAVKFIDFNFSLDYYGAVVICEDCIKESMSLLEMVPLSKLQETVEALYRAVQELEVVQNELDKYKSAFAGLRVIGLTGLANDFEPAHTDETVGESEPTDGDSVDSESDSNGSDSSGGLENLSIFADRSDDDSTK